MLLLETQHFKSQPYCTPGALSIIVLIILFIRCVMQGQSQTKIIIYIIEAVKI